MPTTPAAPKQVQLAKAEIFFGRTASRFQGSPGSAFSSNHTLVPKNPRNESGALPSVQQQMTLRQLEKCRRLATAARMFGEMGHQRTRIFRWPPLWQIPQRLCAFVAAP